MPFMQLDPTMVKIQSSVTHVGNSLLGYNSSVRVGVDDGSRIETWNVLGAFQQGTGMRTGERERMMMPTGRNSSAITECDGTQRMR